MLTYILTAAVVIVFILVVIVAMQPADFRISRSAPIAAPPALVFAQVNDLHKWQAWSPWAKLDPAAKNTHAGPPAGTGAAFTWSGNNQLGEGTMTITDSRPNDLVRLSLEFRRPFKATHTAEFTFTPEGDQTIVTWTMTGKNNFLSKAVVLVMNCDKMLGGQFERGLADLRSVSVAAAAQTPAI